MDFSGRKIDLTTVFQFITGIRIVPRTIGGRTIRYSFVLNEEGSFARPTASTCFDLVNIPLTKSSEEMEKVWLSALMDGGEGFQLR